MKCSKCFPIQAAINRGTKFECVLHKRGHTLHTNIPFPIQNKINDKQISVSRENHVKEEIHCVIEKSDLLVATARGTHYYRWTKMFKENWAKWNVDKYMNLSIKWNLMNRSFQYI